MPDLRPSEAARRSLGLRLRELRLDAGLSGVELADACGWKNYKVSKIENAKQAPSEKDIRTWCAACGQEGRVPDLIALSRQIEEMWTDLRRALRAGQVEIQKRGLGTYGSAQLARVYESLHIPGILQTFEYACAQFRIHARLHGLPVDDVEQAAHNRLTAQVLLGARKPTFSFVIEATALHNNVGGSKVMGVQLDFLKYVAGLPNVALGVIPLGRRRTLFPGEAFYLFDDRIVRQEFWSGALRTSRPEDVSFFARVFTTLQKQAVYGDAARAEIELARERIQAQPEATP